MDDYPTLEGRLARLNHCRSGTHCIDCGSRVRRVFLTLAGGVMSADTDPTPLPGAPAPVTIITCPRCDAYDPSDDR